MYTFNREEYEKRIQWYKEARFGMFIHWGLYAIPARGEWVRHFEEMPSDEYDKYMDEFTAKDCDIREWVHLAKEAGMKYVVFTAKHHDGFCLFDTKYTDFNSMNAPCHRDFVKEFTEAVRAEGLKVGIYYSIIDWRHPDYPHFGDELHPMRNDKSETNENRDFDRYLDFMHSQVRELMTNYGKIDLLFFDYSYDGMRGEKWKASGADRSASGNKGRAGQSCAVGVLHNDEPPLGILCRRQILQDTCDAHPQACGMRLKRRQHDSQHRTGRIRQYSPGGS